MGPTHELITMTSPGNSAAGSWDRGHHAPSTCPRAAVFGFIRNRTSARIGSAPTLSTCLLRDVVQGVKHMLGEVERGLVVECRVVLQCLLDQLDSQVI